MSDRLHQAMMRHEGPALRNRDKEMIPKVLLRAMFGLAIAALAIVTAATVSDRPHVGVPKDAALLESRQLILDGDGIAELRISDAEGNVLADMENGGFVTVVQNGLQRARMLAKAPRLAPVELSRYANGRVVLHDPETGWTVELGSFGPQNKAVVERLFDL